MVSKRRRLSVSNQTGLSKKTARANRAASLIGRHAAPFLPNTPEGNALRDIIDGGTPFNVAHNYFNERVYPVLKAHGDRANARASMNRSSGSLGPPKKRGYVAPNPLGGIGSYINDVGNNRSIPSISMSRSRASSFSSFSGSNRSSGAIGAGYLPKRKLRSKSKVGFGQRIVSTLTPARSLKITLDGVCESGVAVNDADAAYTAVGVTPSTLDTGLCGTGFSQVASNPVGGQNAICVVTLLNSTHLQNMREMTATASLPGTALGINDQPNNNMYYVSNASMSNMISNGTNAPLYFTRYELAKKSRVAVASGSQLYSIFGSMFHSTATAGSEYPVTLTVQTGGLSTVNRSYATVGMKPTEFPSFKDNYRIVKKEKFTLQPGETKFQSLACKVNRRIDMASLYNKYNLTNTDTSTFMVPGLTRIVMYVAHGVPCVSSDTINNGPNRPSTSAASFIIRTTLRMRCHSTFDSRRRYVDLTIAGDGDSILPGQESLITDTGHDFAVQKHI